MKQREGYKIVISEDAQRRIKEDKCPSCGLKKELWTRRKDWRCCSTTCTDKYVREMVTYGWPELRLKAFKRDNFTCVKCGAKKEASELIGDHIKPIALGGDEWDIKNVQTLCIRCDKIKTKKDAGDIARRRVVEKHLRKGQITL